MTNRRRSPAEWLEEWRKAATRTPSRSRVVAEGLATAPGPEDSVAFPAPGTCVCRVQGIEVALDLTVQRLAIEAPQDTAEADLLPGRQDQPTVVEPKLVAHPGLGFRSAFVSASELAQKAKCFDDGLMAAVELAAHAGLGRHRGTRALLGALGSALVSTEPSATQSILLGAARLGGVEIGPLKAEVDRAVTGRVEAFLADDRLAKPMSFYSWLPQLESLFRQDRMLQSELKDDAGLARVVEKLRTDSAARETYERHLRLLARLTNPFASLDVLTLLENAPGPSAPRAGGLRFLPPSIAHETRLARELFGDRPIPDGFVLADELVRRIEAGEIDLEPRADSGWYDHQTWALEALLSLEREGERLEVRESYRQHLRDLFKAQLAGVRESHVKQLEFPEFAMALGPERLRIAPGLSVEPLPTFYLRRALAYRFVRGVLEEAFGPGEIGAIRRLTIHGPVGSSLDEELADMESLWLGAHVQASQDLGLVADASCGDLLAAERAAQRFRSWAAGRDSDVDLGTDVRAMVPVFFDRQRNQTKAWLFLGWATRPITVSFVERPGMSVRRLDAARDQELPRIDWVSQHEEVFYPVTAEVSVGRLLDREEFRALCDACGTRSEILKRVAGESLN